MVDAFARVLGTEPPDDAEFAALLELAGIASRRTAAPGSCWLAARAGVPPSDAPARARGLADEAG